MTSIAFHFFISSLLTAITTFVLAIFVLSRNPKSKLYRIFFIYTISITAWSLPYAFMANAPTKQMGYILGRTFLLFANFICVFFVHFILTLLDEPLTKKKKILFPLYSVAIIFALLFLFPTNLIVTDVSPKFELNYFNNAGSLFYIYLTFWMGCVTYALIRLFVAYINASGARRNQLKYLFFASLIGYVGGPANFLLTVDIKYPFFPYGTYAIPLYSAITAYAILRHNLLNLGIIIKKTIAYSILISIITIIYFIIVYILEKIFSVILGYHSIAFAIFIVTIFSIIFTPLKSKIQLIIDKYFFHGTIDQIDEENIKLREELQKSEKLKAVATLAAGMAHEIKNPLTSIKTFTEYIPEKRDDPVFLDKFYKIVRGEVARINYIVQELLEFSKPSELHLKKADINDLLNETLELLNNDLIRKNIKIQKELSSLPETAIDPSQIKQVLLNILLNSIDSIKNGGTLILSTKNNQDEISIVVKDTGTGINKEDLKHIFDPFFSKKDGGTGLGLSVVHGIIEKHRGNIKVNSTVGEGTTFEIILPIT